jgi:malate synthase
MEDAATAEIARAQLWQWIHHPKGVLNDGRKVTAALIRQIIQEELASIRTQVGEPRYQTGHYALATELFDKIVTNDEFAEFLTLEAYHYLP